MNLRSLLVNSVFLVLALGPAALAQEDVLVTGRLDVNHGENFETGRHDVLYRVVETEAPAGQPARSFQVDFDPGEVPDDLTTGSLVQIRGKSQAGGVLSARAADGGQLTVNARGVSTPTSDQRTIVMLIDFQDLPLDPMATSSSVAGIMFNNPDAINALFRESTGNAVGFSGDVVGPYVVPFDSTSSNYYAWAHDAEAQAQAQGVDLSLYTRRVFVTPPNGTGYAGVANLGGTNTRAWIFRWANRLAYAHELGHNLGMRHASTPTATYGDQSCIMGNAPGLRHCNAPHKIGMGWLPPNQVTTAGSGVYTIKAIAEPGGGTRALRIPVSGASDVYVSFRNYARFDQELVPGYAYRTSVHTWNGVPSANTYLQQRLLDGQSYSNDGITVTQLSNDGVQATVSVSVISTPRRPAIQLSPAQGAAQPGVTRTYSLTLTNRDSGTSAPTVFTFTISGQSTSWTYAVVPSVVSVDAGTSETVQVQVTSRPTDPDSSASVTIHVTGGAPVHATQATLTHFVDGTAPTAPSRLQANADPGRVKLLWIDSQDANASLGLNYVIWRDGIQVGATSLGAPGTSGQTIYTDYPGAGTFTYEVSCVDDAGNESSRSNAVTITVGVGPPK